MVVDDLRKPIAEKNFVDGICLRERAHVEVPIVIVSCVFVIETRKARERTVGWIPFLHVPVRYQFHSVRINEAIQNDNVVEKPLRLRIGSADELVDVFDELLRSENLRRVKTTVDPNYRLAFFGKRPCLVIG